MFDREVDSKWKVQPPKVDEINAPLLFPSIKLDQPIYLPNHCPNHFLNYSFIKRFKDATISWTLKAVTDISPAISSYVDHALVLSGWRDSRQEPCFPTLFHVLLVPFALSTVFFVGWPSVYNM